LETCRRWRKPKKPEAQRPVKKVEVEVEVEVEGV
jgi:hypothetical protein